MRPDKYNRFAKEGVLQATDNPKVPLFFRRHPGIDRVRAVLMAAAITLETTSRRN